MIVAAVAAAALAAPARAKPVGGSHPAWMVGKWALLDAAQRLDPQDCPEPEFYGRNGYVSYTDGVDRWWIEGNYLVRVVVKPTGGGSPAEVGQTVKQRFTRIRPGELAFKTEGSAQRLVRCGPIPAAWIYRPAR